MKNARLKQLFGQYRLEVVLWNLWEHRELFIEGEFKLMCAATVAIEFCETGGYEDNRLQMIPLEHMTKLVEAACAFCVNNDRKMDISSDSNDGIFLLIKALANQLAAICGDAYHFARSYVLFFEIARGIPMSHLNADLPTLFANEKGYQIEEYLRSCFIAFSAIRASGKMDDAYLEEVQEINGVPKFEVLNRVLGDISFLSRAYRRTRREVNPVNCFGYHPLLERPIIKPWSDMPMNALGKRYLAPLPNLIAEEACSGIYHHFVTKYGNDFNTFFGKHIFEPYVGKLLDACQPDRIVSECELETIRGRRQGIRLVDFVFIKGDCAILVECKAFRFPRRVFTHGTKDDFRESFGKLNTDGMGKFPSFEAYFGDTDLLNGKRIIRLLVTYESLIGMDGGSSNLVDLLAKSFLPAEQIGAFREQRSQICILSCPQMDRLQPLLSEKNTLAQVLLRLLEGESFSGVLNGLKSEKGGGFDQSWLWPVFRQIYEPMIETT